MIEDVQKKICVKPCGTAQEPPVFEEFVSAHIPKGVGCVEFVDGQRLSGKRNVVFYSDVVQIDEGKRKVCQALTLNSQSTGSKG